ncbi:Superoxide dismutase [Mn], mitochondrial [Ptychographa xylographoides]|nr:Superoxide dismutase [Mn], mitochondrial [Ptychographa xylographoides]
MAWDQLAIDKPHLAYLIIGGFTSLFMLCSLYVKERLYIGEATVATLCGVIFGPHAANLFDPGTWGNVDKITLECSRIVLVVQCFAVGVELPKAYMERHWRSVTFLLVPVMTFGWLITSLFIWWMVVPLNWLESLAVAACVTATDPVLASSVVGKGKFAKRVPKHLRDLLSAESGCNDGMAFPFIYLSIYLIRYRPDAGAVTYHWLCFVVLYECIFGAVYGFLIGYIGRHAIKWADSKQLIDRESFLVFYFVLALFCAGSGSTLGLDDLLVGFSAGVGFSNDGWFTQKTEESHVSNVIDLLLNLAYFVFLGSIIPWQLYNAPELGLTPWRLVVIALMVIFFRRIPIMLALKPLVPDIKNWREALFAGHFGPIGVGAIFAAILARAELENESTEPLAVLPGPGSDNYILIQVIWPIVTFLVISSILVHGSSIAVFTLGKHINTLTLTMSYTQANEDGPSWMNRLPRIASTSKSMSKSKDDWESTGSSDEKLPEFPPGTLPPVGFRGNFLRRQKEEDDPSNTNSRASSLRPSSRRRRWDSGLGPGGPVSQSAIMPQRRQEPPSATESETLNDTRNHSPDSEDDGDAPDGLEMQEANDRHQQVKREEKRTASDGDPDVEVYEEGDEMIIEDEEGNVLSADDVEGETLEQRRQTVMHEKEKLRKETSGEHTKAKHESHAKNEGEDLEHEVVNNIEHPSHGYQKLRKRVEDWSGRHRHLENTAASTAAPKQEHHRGPAHAYQYGNTIIVEDEDGEVVKKYDISAPQKKPRTGEQGGSNIHSGHVRKGLHRVGTWAGIGANERTDGEGQLPDTKNEARIGVGGKRGKSAIVDDDDDRLRFTITSGGKRMSKQDFIKQIQSLDPKARAKAVENSDAPEGVKEDARRHAEGQDKRSGPDLPKGRPAPSTNAISYNFPASSPAEEEGGMAEVQQVDSQEDRPKGDRNLTLVDSNGEDIPFHGVTDAVTKYSAGHPETAASRRRRLASRKDSDDDGTDRIPPSRQQRRGSPPEPSFVSPGSTMTRQESSMAKTAETNAERRRRLAALGEPEDGLKDNGSDSDDNGEERKPRDGHQPVSEPGVRHRAPGIRFADSPAVSQGRIQWGEDVGRKGRGR